jgi:hypothetical protein
MRADVRIKKGLFIRLDLLLNMGGEGLEDIIEGGRAGARQGDPEAA